VVTEANARRGLLYGLTAYTLWGLMPLYFGQIPHVPAHEILCHRIVWSALLLGGILLAFRRGPALWQAVTTPRTLLLLMASTLFIAFNWFAYIYSVVNGMTLHSALGYYILPLFNVVLGLAVFGERLRPWQWVALALASAGLVYLLVAVGELPWITFTLAISFTAYGVLRKVAPVDALTGLTVETLLLVPVALGALLLLASYGTPIVPHTDAKTTAILIFSGVATTIPLVCFGVAARLLPLTVLGLIQYVSPTLQFLCAVLFLKEEFSPARQVCFAFTWLALLIFSVEGLVHARRKVRPALELPPLPVAREGVAALR
jgi:chloramphenicol-sensitive protein RarD